MRFTCIMCPIGCTLTVTKKNGKITVTGNACPLGEIYGKKEITKPERVVTTLKLYKTGTISLKTSTAIPKKLIDKCLKLVKNTPPPTKIKVGDVYIHNILGTKADLIVTSINL